MDKSCYGKDEQPGSCHIELRYLPGDDTVVVQAVGDLSGDTAEAGGSWEKRTAAGRQSPRTAKLSKHIRNISGAIARGKTLREAADAPIVRTSDHHGVRAAFEHILERQL